MHESEGTELPIVYNMDIISCRGTCHDGVGDIYDLCACFKAHWKRSSLANQGTSPEFEEMSGRHKRVTDNRGISPASLNDL